MKKLKRPKTKSMGKCRDCRWEHGRHEQNTRGEYFLTKCPYITNRSVFLDHECESDKFEPKK